LVTRHERHQFQHAWQFQARTTEYQEAPEAVYLASKEERELLLLDDAASNSYHNRPINSCLSEEAQKDVQRIPKALESDISVPSSGIYLFLEGFDLVLVVFLQLAIFGVVLASH
jgi:hypothetical protein